MHYSLYIDSFLFLLGPCLNLSCIFSILVSRLFICDSILISGFWIIFTIIFLNSLSGRFPISSSFFLVWWTFILFLYLLSILLSLPLVYIAEFGVAFLYSGSVCSSLYCGFLAVGGVVWVAFQGFLVREACVSVLVSGAGFLLSGVQ